MNAIAQTANIETIAARRLAHKTENFSVDLTEGKTQAAILTEIKDANFNIGTKSLSALLKGEKTEAGDFMIVGGMQIIDGAALPEAPKMPTAEEKATAKAAADEAKAAAKALSAKKMAEDAMKKSGGAPEADKIKEDVKAYDKKEGDTAAPNVVTPPADGEVKPEVAAEPAKAVEPKAPRALIDWGDELPPPGVYREVKPGTMIDRLFQALMKEGGATKAALQAEFGWSSGGMSGVIGWEPKKKGYHLASPKIDGVIHHHLEFHQADPEKAGQRVTPADIKYVQPKPAPEPKAPKAPKEPKVAKAPADPKAPVVSTRRLSPKKQKELDEANAAAALKAESAPAPEVKDEAAPV